MKKKFEGTIHNNIIDGIEINEWLNSESLHILAQSRDAHFSLVTHSCYICTEYKISLNLLTFGGAHLRVPVTVIAPPFSIDSAGYSGDLNKLIFDYKKRKGIYLLLNLSQPPILAKQAKQAKQAAIGETLPACLFYNRFSCFEQYLFNLRSGYRRRVKKALEKGAALRIEKIKNCDFTQALHSLYLQVLKNSKYPLETLGLNFFRYFDGDTYVFYDKNEPVAFVMLKQFDNKLSFVFGGMDYAKRDKFDLYYNMLLLILKQAIKNKIPLINLGQTAEHTKQSIGCVLSKRYMLAFASGWAINKFLVLFKSSLEYKSPAAVYRCFASGEERVLGE